MLPKIIVLTSLVKQLEARNIPSKDLQCLTDPGAVVDPTIFINVNKIVERGHQVLVKECGSIDHDARDILETLGVKTRVGHCAHRNTPTCDIVTDKGVVALV